MDLAKIQSDLQIKFKNPSLLKQAMTHPSMESLCSYERLEFLGDSVLSMVVAQMLFKLFPTDREGSLSKKHVSLVCRDTLVKIAQNIGIGKYMILSSSEEKTGGRQKASNLENTLEALIAAIFLDSGLGAAKEFIKRHWYEIAKNTKIAPTNPKNILQELAQSKGMQPPVYQLLEKKGQDHNPIFEVMVKMQSEYGTGKASSKKLAEQDAAQDLLQKIDAASLKK